MTAELRERQLNRIYDAFTRVYRLVLQAFPKFGDVIVELECEEIAKERKTNARAFMHIGHVKKILEGADVICVAPVAAGLAEPYLIGLFLHEFGHLGSEGDDKAADEWVMTELGIPIEYKGPNTLEWVDPKIIREKRI